MKRALLCLVLSAFLREAPAQEIGRLFFTPEQRAALDGRRRARVPDTPAVTVVAPPTTRVGWLRAPLRRALDYLGERRTARRRRSRGVRVSVPVGNAGVRFSLKPGQVLDRGNGEVRDVLGPGGELRVRPAK
jgi:hypothetical protein